MTEDQALRFIEAQIGKRFGSVAHLAREAGVSRQLLSLMFAGRRAIPDKVLDLVGLERDTSVTYRRKGKS